MRFTDGFLALLNYCLCDIGLRYYLWPALSHFRHAEVKMPQVADIISNLIVLPVLAALLTASLGRKRVFSLWPFAVGPTIVAALVFIFAESEFPTSWHDTLGLIGAVLVAALAATGGAYSARYLAGDRHVITNERTLPVGS
jgi:hypothetical protein